jgi:hypothetical protein
VTPNGRFQFRLFGTELARVFGRDLIGRFLDGLAPKAPISIANGRWYNEVSRLLLPLATESGTVGFVMGADYVRP